MIRRFLFLLMFFFIASVFSFAADTYSEVPGGGLFIGSYPSGAKVFIDGIERGLTPYSVSTMRTGEYNIRIYKEGYAERRFRVVIRRNSRVEISIDLEEARGKVFLEIRKDPDSPLSLPWGPRVFVDGTRISLPDTNSPFIEQELSIPIGWRTISIEAFGFERESTRILVEEGSIQKLELVHKPAPFTLSDASLRKKRFNSRNSGMLGNAEMSFTVSGPGEGVLEVLNSKREIIYSINLNSFTTWQQQALWDGRDNNGEIAEDGSYILRITAWNDSERQSAELQVIVDSSVTMRPLSISSALPGLMFCPSPEALPAFSFQIEGSLVSGKPLLLDAWESLPFAVGFRMSFMDKLEAALAFNASPGFSGGSEWGLGTSVKWVFFKPLNVTTGSRKFSDTFGMAAEVSFGWATTGPYTPFGMGTGPGLHLPLEWRVMQGEKSSFDILFSPLVLWASEKGYPDSFLPRLGTEGGILYTYGSIAFGLSLRWDYNLNEKVSGPVVSALEFKFFPSNFVLSVMGGFWHLQEETINGAFFGIGLGIMF